MIHKENLKNYKKKEKGLGNDEDIDQPKSWQVTMPIGTRAGLIHYLSRILHCPAGLCFMSGEYDELLSNMYQKHNADLLSFYTRLFDGYSIEEDCLKETAKDEGILVSVDRSSVSICGVSTETGFVASLPQKAKNNGFIQRGAFYLNKPRDTSVPFEGQLDQILENKLELILRYIEHWTRDLCKREQVLDFILSPEARKMWEEIYTNVKHLMNRDSNSALNGSIRRKLCDYGVKFALIFEIVALIEACIECFLTEPMIENVQQYLGKPEELYPEELKNFFSENIFADKSARVISKESLKMSIDWVNYLIATDEYVYDNYLTENLDNEFDKYKDKIMAVLKQHPMGILKRELQRKVGMHKKQRGDLFKDIIDCLKDENVTSVSKNKTGAFIIKLKSYILK